MGLMTVLEQFAKAKEQPGNKVLSGLVGGVPSPPSPAPEAPQGSMEWAMQQVDDQFAPGHDPALGQPDYPGRQLVKSYITAKSAGGTVSKLVLNDAIQKLRNMDHAGMFSTIQKYRAATTAPGTELASAVAGRPVQPAPVETPIAKPLAASGGAYPLQEAISRQTGQRGVAEALAQKPGTIEHAMTVVDRMIGPDNPDRDLIKSYLWSNAGGGTGITPAMVGDALKRVKSGQQVLMQQAIQAHRANRAIPENVETANLMGLIPKSTSYDRGPTPADQLATVNQQIVDQQRLYPKQQAMLDSLSFDPRMVDPDISVVPGKDGSLIPIRQAAYEYQQKTGQPLIKPLGEFERTGKGSESEAYQAVSDYGRVEMPEAKKGGPFRNLSPEERKYQQMLGDVKAAALPLLQIGPLFHDALNEAWARLPDWQAGFGLPTQQRSEQELARRRGAAAQSAALHTAPYFALGNFGMFLMGSDMAGSIAQQGTPEFAWKFLESINPAMPNLTPEEQGGRIVNGLMLAFMAAHRANVPPDAQAKVLSAKFGISENKAIDLLAQSRDAMKNGDLRARVANAIYDPSFWAVRDALRRAGPSPKELDLATRDRNVFDGQPETGQGPKEVDPTWRHWATARLGSVLHLEALGIEPTAQEAEFLAQYAPLLRESIDKFTESTKGPKPRVDVANLGPLELPGPKPEEPNAGQEQGAETVHGDLRTPSPPVEGEVPTEVGGKGVRPDEGKGAAEQGKPETKTEEEVGQEARFPNDPMERVRASDGTWSYINHMTGKPMRVTVTDPKTKEAWDAEWSALKEKPSEEIKKPNANENEVGAAGEAGGRENGNDAGLRTGEGQKGAGKEEAPLEKPAWQMTREEFLKTLPGMVDGSDAQKAALKSHEEAVKIAIDKGQEVPIEVVKQYPHLLTQQLLRQSREERAKLKAAAGEDLTLVAPADEPKPGKPVEMEHLKNFARGWKDVSTENLVPHPAGSNDTTVWADFYPEQADEPGAHKLLQGYSGTGDQREYVYAVKHPDGTITYAGRAKTPDDEDLLQKAADSVVKWEGEAKRDEEGQLAQERSPSEKGIPELIDLMDAAQKAGAFESQAERHAVATAFRQIAEVYAKKTGTKAEDYYKGLKTMLGVQPMRGALLQEAAAPFYSKLERVIQEKVPNKASAEQIRKTLEAAGVKKEEMEWTGTSRLLDRGGTFTKEDLLKEVRANAIKIDEVMQGGPGAIDKYEDLPQTMRNLVDRLNAERITPAEFRDAARARGYEAEFDMAGDLEHIRKKKGPLPTRYDAYKLAGGTDYRELLLRIPLSGAGFRSSHWTPDNVVVHVRFDTRPTPSGQSLHIAEIQSDWHQMGRKQGYRQPAPPEAQEVEKQLHEAEVAADAAEAELDRITRELLKTKPKIYVVQARPNNRGPWTTVSYHDTPLEAIMEARRYAQTTDQYVRSSNLTPYNALPEVRAARRRLNAARIRVAAKQEELDELMLPTREGVPDAPFKTTWPELALKRMIRYAAENGYESISWDSGATNAQRYSLEKHVSKIRYSTAGNYLEAWDLKGDLAITRTVKPEDLESVVGKEIAERLLARTPEETADHVTSKTLSDVDLAVGGEGMKSFYDKMLPTIAEKLVKRFGAKVESGSVSTHTHRGKLTYSGPEVTEEEVWAALQKHAGSRNADLAVFRQLKAIAAAIKEGSTTADAVSRLGSVAAAEMIGGTAKWQAATRSHPVWVLKLTKALSAYVLNESQPLFQAGHQGAKAWYDVTNRTIGLFTHVTDVSSLLHEGAHDWMNPKRLLPEHVAVLEKHFGPAGSKDYYEGSARAFETYMRTGEAPIPALQRIFDIIKAAMLRIYRSLIGTPLKEKIAPEVKKVFDEMLGKEEEAKAPTPEPKEPKTPKPRGPRPKVGEVVKFEDLGDDFSDFEDLGSDFSDLGVQLSRPHILKQEAGGPPPQPGRHRLIEGIRGGEPVYAVKHPDGTATFLGGGDKANIVKAAKDAAAKWDAAHPTTEANGTEPESGTGSGAAMGGGEPPSGSPEPVPGPQGEGATEGVAGGPPAAGGSDNGPVPQPGPRPGPIEAGGAGTPEPSGGGGAAGSGSNAVGAGTGGESTGGAPKPNKPSRPNYRITGEEEIGARADWEKEGDLIRALEVLKKYDEGAELTPADLLALARFPGWGWTGNRLRPEARGSLYYDVKRLLSEKELQSALGATLNSHFTSVPVIKALWKGLERIGFEKGSALETSAGAGAFLGLAPPGVSWHARELDLVTAKVLEALYPQASVTQGPYEESHYKPSSFDAAISNIPFGNYKVFDPAFNTPELRPLRQRIHNYFFAKALTQVRQGGLVAFITSAGTLDAGDEVGRITRAYLAKHAVFLGAIRLPNTAFGSSASTSVTTDIIFLRKRFDGETAPGEAFQNLRNVVAKGGHAEINEYFERNPDMVLGSHSMEGGMYGPGSYTLDPPNNERAQELGLKDLGLRGEARIEALLNAAMKRLPKGAYDPSGELVPSPDAPEDLPPVDVRTGGYYIASDGSVHIKASGLSSTKPDLDPSTEKLIRDYIPLRDTLVGLQSMMASPDASDDDIKAQQADLKKLYDKFVKAHGKLNGKVKKFLQNDPEGYTVLALETEKGLSDIFTERVIKPKILIESSPSPHDAVLASLNNLGRVDMGEIERLTGMDENAIVDTLKGFIFQDPETSDYVLAEEYGSGNVRKKLEVAEKAAKGNDRMLDNVRFLQSVQPPQLDASQIQAKLGAMWIPLHVYSDFARELTGRRISVQRADFTGSYKVEKSSSPSATSEWGLPELTATQILEAMLNYKPVQVTYKQDGKTYIDEVQTAVAVSKAAAIKVKWADWIYADGERTDSLTEIYNREVNAYVARKYDGSHLTLPRLRNMTARPHQLNAIWRNLQSRNTLDDHDPGTGKTLIFAASAVEATRIGLRNKPLIVVHNSTIGQYEAIFRDNFPDAKVLIADTNANFTAQQRKRFIGLIASNNWDAVVITHSQLAMMPMSPAGQEGFYREQIEDAKAAMDGADDYTVKEIEKKIKSLEAKLKELAAKLKDTQLETTDWENLGIDMMLVDEAHAYKNMGYYSSLPRMGKDWGQHNIAFFQKVRHVQKIGGSVVLGTGTPLTNSPAESYVWLKYLLNDQLAQLNINSFDSFAKSFTDVTSELERNVAGIYGVYDRIRKFVNLPELIALYQQAVDSIRVGDVLDLGLPKLVDEEGNETGKPIVITTKPNPAQMAVFKRMAQMAAALKGGGKPKKGDPNMLSISTIGRKASLDARLVIPDAPDYPDSKINTLTALVYKIYSDPEVAKNKGAQAIKINFGIPGGASGMDLYNDIKQKLIRLGVPAKEIAFASSPKNDAERLALWAKVNSGEVRVIIGSADKMGIGVNMQERLFALHHVDPEWNPAPVWQTDARILRQGNTWSHVRIYHHITANTFDDFMWLKVATKEGWILQFSHYDPSKGLREIEDDGGEEAFTLAEIAQVTSGDPLIAEYMKLKQEVETLRAEHYGQQAEQDKIRRKIPYIEGEVLPALNEEKTALEAFAKKLDVEGDLTIGEKTYDTPKAAGGAIVAAAKAMIERGDMKADLGTFRGMTVRITAPAEGFQKGHILLQLKGAGEHEVSTWDITTATYADEDTVQNYLPSVGQRLPSATKDIDVRLKRIAEAIDENEKALTMYKRNLGVPWPKQQRFEEASARYALLMETVGRRLESGGAGGWGASIQLTDEENALLGQSLGREAAPATEPEQELGPDVFGNFSIPHGAGSAPQSPYPLSGNPIVALAQKQKAFSNTLDAIIQDFSPGSVGGEPTKQMMLRLRQLGGARATAAIRWANIFKKANRFFDNPKSQRWQWYDRVERGLPQPTAELTEFARAAREQLEALWKDLSRVKDGQVGYIINYLPHAFKRPDLARQFFATMMGKRPLSGTKGHMKQRTIPFMIDAINKGLEPAFDNPIDLILFCLNDVNKFITMVDHLRNPAIQDGTAVFKRAHERMPENYDRINDNAFTVYSPGTVTVHGFYDKLQREKLEEFAKSIGIKHTRKARIGGRRAGFAEGPDITTAIGGPNSVIAHEIGHAIDHKYNLSGFLASHKWDKGVRAAELRALSDLRFEGMEAQTSDYFKKYVRRREEKMAAIFEAYIHAPDKAKAVAPKTIRLFEQFMSSKPELAPFLKIRPSIVLGHETGEVKAAGMHILGEWVFPEALAKIANNWLSPGLAGVDSKLGAGIYKGIQATNNSMKQMALAFSAFHGFFVLNEALISTVAEGMYDVINGTLRANPKRILHGTANTLIGIAPGLNLAPVFKRLWEGRQVIKAIKAADDPLDPQMRLVVDGIIKSNLNVTGLQSYYGGGAAYAWGKAFRQHKWGTVALKSAGAFLEAVSYPIMGYLVPTIKAGTFKYMFMKSVNQMLAAGKRPTYGELKELGANIADLIEQRYGQMNKDNIFWNRALLDIATQLTLSPTWQMGTLQTFGGGIKDIIPFGAVGQGIKEGDWQKALLPPGDKSKHITGDWFSRRTAYLIAAPIVIAILGYIVTRLLTGKAPKRALDLYFPPTGKKNADGTEERIKIPGYHNDAYGIGNEFWATMLHKGSPAASLAGDLISGHDFEGRPTTGSIFDLARTVGNHYMPISVSTLRNKAESSGITTPMALAGISKAPAYVSRSKALNLAKEFNAQNGGGGISSDAQIDKRKARMEALQARRNSESPAATLARSDARQVAIQARMTPLEASMKNLHYDQILPVIQAATDQERQEIRRSVLQRGVNAVKSGHMTREQFRAIKAELDRK